MAKPIREPKVRKLKIAKPKVRHLNADEVAAALGAEATAKKIAGHPSPLSMFRLRRDIAEQLRSSGGRPALSDTNMQKKIPLSEQNWEELETLADHLSAELSKSETARIRKVTASQIASRLLHLALEQIHQEVRDEESEPFVVALREALTK